eukprot:TRINITY_DN35051_c0_g1_i1.p1 TRINITY_DN35051_c0_g1~~TRINITY_DN35051_c0_g1_i1.p1  ORF type:complete len:322 (+),score=44.99 TRINITY_DN35051_c0_g1_i1:41-1006(+)
MPASRTDGLCHGVMPAIVTPFTADGEVAVEVVGKLTKKLVEDGADGFFVTGNTGEGFALTVPERETVVREVMKEANGLPVIFHVGSRSIEEAISLAKTAKELKCHGVSSVVPPTSTSMEETVAYFKQIGEATDLPFYVYYFAPKMGKPFSPQDFLESMKSVPNFEGIKFTDKDFSTLMQIASLKQQIYGGDRPLTVLTGPDDMALGGRAMGAHGAIGSTYNLQAKTMKAMFNAFDSGDHTKAVEIQEAANRVIMILVRHADCASRPYNITETIKLVLTWMGYPVGHQREGKRLTSEEEAAFKAELTVAVSQPGVIDTFGLI